MIRRAVLGGIAALVAVAAVGVAPAAAEDFPVEGPPRAVWVQGDSVLLGAIDQVRDILGDWSATVAAFVGLDTRTATRVFRERNAELGSVVVVELGLNEATIDPATYGRYIDDAMAAIGPGRHVIWLTGARFRPEVDRLNGAIRAAAERHPNYEVLEWGAFVDAHPEATYDDHVHLRPAGRLLLADAIDRAVEGWWRSRCALPEAERTGAIQRLYLAYFDRRADEDGMAYWSSLLDDGTLCLADVSEHFTGSAEFVATYGDLGIPEFVRLVYVNVLGREPDPGGYEHWANRLAYGGLRRGTMMTYFSQSPEFRVTSGIS